METCIEDGNVLLEVKDSGPGIDEEHLERLFEPFFTTKGPQTTGMGLAAVYGIINGYGGSITVDSGPEKRIHFSCKVASVH